MGKVLVQFLLTDVTGTGAGSEAFKPVSKHRTFQAYGTTSAGVGAASIDVEVSNDGTNYIVLGSIDLVLGTSAVTDGFTSVAPWKFVRGNVASISGTNGTVSLTMGNEAV